MKKILQLSLLALFALGLTNCGDGSAGRLEEEKDGPRLVVRQFKFTVQPEGPNDALLSRISAVDEQVMDVRKIMPKVMADFSRTPPVERDRLCFIKFKKSADNFLRTHAPMIAKKAKQIMKDKKYVVEKWTDKKVAELGTEAGYKKLAKGWGFVSAKEIAEEIKKAEAKIAKALEGEVVAALASITRVADEKETIARTQIVKDADFDYGEAYVKQLVKEVSERAPEETDREVFLTLFIKNKITS